MYPVQKGTEKVANRLFPNAGSQEPSYLETRRMEIFETQLRYALLDGELKEKERHMLSGLRDSLGLRPKELRAVIERFPQFPSELLWGQLASASPTP